MNVEKTKVIRISRQPSPVIIMIDQKQLEKLEFFKYLGSMLTNDGRCTCEIKFRIAMAKAAFNKKKNLFTSTLVFIPPTPSSLFEIHFNNIFPPKLIPCSCPFSFTFSSHHFPYTCTSSASCL